MKDGTEAGEPAEVSCQELYDAYLSSYRELCTEVGPCRDARVLRKAAQYLLKEAEPGGTFTLFPFYEAVSQNPESVTTDCRKHLWAVIKATELLETLCVNLFLQPWKKEIKTIKTFTGSFVYHLLPVLSSSTIQSVLASIGYLPHTDTPSEFTLSEDANPDRAMQVGFQLLLARVECLNLLELLEKDQLGPQEWLEVLQKKVGHIKPEEPTEKKVTVEPKEEEKTKKEETDRKEVSLYLDTSFALPPQPKPWCSHHSSLDQSIIEMQRNYPDLAFRGRPLVQDKLQQANSSRSSSCSKDVHTASDDCRVTEPLKRDNIKGTRGATTAFCKKNNSSKADDVLGNNSCGTNPQGSTTSSGTNESGVDDELSGPQAISLHITLRTGSKAEKSRKPEEPQTPAEEWMQQQALADAQNNKPDLLSSMSSVDDDQDLIDLAERMGQIHVQETKDEMNRKEESRRGDENKRKERRKKGRKMRAQEESEEHNLRKPVMEIGPAVSHDVSRCTRSSLSVHAVMKQQKQATASHHLPLNISTADCESSKGGGGSTGQQEGEEAGRAETGHGEEEHLAQSFVIVEHHKK
ncbi:Spermatogenesis-associated protein 2 Spermatogenesis-associated protein PD1 [Channa argus]|uniref:Spermatogenesis-associated protein 2 Spermatogenesis-associated protein PD1 n=1 Tax=Channa argus TaxID=215402 RepID=A0A6G1R284_CHAAH|nr:Spermatogenesis-associated protein 2 Spermatogenesis-associated protein PD1 [Channa argus]